jgi:hypothetical protein
MEERPQEVIRQDFWRFTTIKYVRLAGPAT